MWPTGCSGPSCRAVFPGSRTSGSPVLACWSLSRNGSSRPEMAGLLYTLTSRARWMPLAGNWAASPITVLCWTGQGSWSGFKAARHALLPPPAPWAWALTSPTSAVSSILAGPGRYWITGRRAAGLGGMGWPARLLLSIRMAGMIWIHGLTRSLRRISSGCRHIWRW
ncbi:hypothetical protein BDV11DRAFT_201272 [Aspergillus similis]